MNSPIAVDTYLSADNLEIMRGIQSETIDRNYLDPPFNTKKEYKVAIGSPAEGAAFKDTWTLMTMLMKPNGTGELAEQAPGSATQMIQVGAEKYLWEGDAELPHGMMSTRLARDETHT